MIMNTKNRIIIAIAILVLTVLVIILVVNKTKDTDEAEQTGPQETIFAESDAEAGIPYSTSEEIAIFNVAEKAVVDELESQGNDVATIISREWYLTDDDQSIDVVVYLRLTSGKSGFWVSEIKGDSDDTHKSVRIYKPDERYRDV